MDTSERSYDDVEEGLQDYVAYLFRRPVALPASSQPFAVEDAPGMEFIFKVLCFVLTKGHEVLSAKTPIHELSSADVLRLKDYFRATGFDFQTEKPTERHKDFFGRAMMVPMGDPPTQFMPLYFVKLY